MEEDYVSFEIAKLLKEKGFDESCYQKYDDEGYLSFNHVGYINAEKPTEDFSALAPTLQMAMKWLREVHNLFIEIHFCQDTYEDVCCEVGWKEPTYNYRVIGIGNNDTYYVDTDFNSYESACESAIKYCLISI